MLRGLYVRTVPGKITPARPDAAETVPKRFDRSIGGRIYSPTSFISNMRYAFPMQGLQ
jgi:hypothetical protein